MMHQDIEAQLEAISLLFKDMETTDRQTDALRTYATIMVLCKDLRRSAEEYNGTHNINGVIPSGKKNDLLRLFLRFVG